jgi:hypothetical protein
VRPWLKSNFLSPSLSPISSPPITTSPAPPAAATPAALHGIQDPPDVAAHRLEPDIVLCHAGIMLFHSRIDLADVLPVLFGLAPLLVNLVGMPGHNLGQVPDNSSHDPYLAPEILNTRSHSVQPNPNGI